MLGHAGMQTPGSPLRVPVSVSVNRGDPRALAQRGLELALEHGGSVAVSRAHPEGFGKGERGRPGDAPHAGLPFPNTGSHLRSGAASFLLPAVILNTPTSVTAFQLQSFLRK